MFKKKVQETGRSMVEVLGVLAVIGVLSVTGIAGYKYAMNKYISNNFINEINMISHQLATTLSTAINDRKAISLGEPYDNGYMVTNSYMFTYGCGNYGSAEQNCHSEETGYWISVGGISKNICQNVLLNSGHLTYIVEQELNGEVISDDANCTEEDNEILFWFNSDESGEYANYIEYDNNTEYDNEYEEEIPEDIPTVNCPGETSVKGLGGFAIGLPEEETGRIVNCYCPINTKYTNEGTCETLPENCKTNNDCNKEEYCNIPKSVGNVCSTDTTSISGTCRNTRSDIKSPQQGTTSPFILSISMTWWSANNFCQALGKKLADVSDYDCAHKICTNDCDAKTGFCHANTSLSVSSSSSSNISTIMNALKKAYSSTYGWTNTVYNGCNQYFVYFPTGYVYYNGRNRTHSAICTD